MNSGKRQLNNSNLGATTGVTSCGDTSASTTLNFINPDYPSSTSQQGDCILTLEVQPGVCQVKITLAILT